MYGDNRTTSAKGGPTENAGAIGDVLDINRIDAPGTLAIENRRFIGQVQWNRWFDAVRCFWIDMNQRGLPLLPLFLSFEFDQIEFANSHHLYSMFVSTGMIRQGHLFQLDQTNGVGLSSILLALLYDDGDQSIEFTLTLFSTIHRRREEIDDRIDSRTD